MRQREVDEGGGAAECLLINLINCIERQVEEDQVLNLIEERVRDEADFVSRQIQMF